MDARVRHSRHVDLSYADPLPVQAWCRQLSLIGRSAGSMKKAIGTLAECLSELDIKRRRLTVLSCMPPGGKTQEMRPSFIGAPDFFNLACAEACVLSNRLTNCSSRLGLAPRSSRFERYLKRSRSKSG